MRILVYIIRFRSRAADYTQTCKRIIFILKIAKTTHITRIGATLITTTCLQHCTEQIVMKKI